MFLYRVNPLSEKRREFLKERLLKHVELDDESKKDATSAEIKERTENLNFILDEIHQADPSVSGEYAGWIIKLFLQEKIRLPEDRQKLQERLTQFSKNKHKFPVDQRDINRYQDYGSLAQAVDQYAGVLGKLEEERIQTIEGQQVVLEETSPRGHVYRVIKVTSPQATTKLARGTDWCIKDPRFSKDYLAAGPLYFIDKNNGRYLLAHAKDTTKTREAYQKFKSFIDDNLRNQRCSLCGAWSDKDNLTCATHEAWQASLLAASHDEEAFSSLAAAIAALPEGQTGGLHQFGDEAEDRHSDLQIMDIYDNPAELDDYELGLLQRFFNWNDVNLLIGFTDHLRSPEDVKKLGSKVLAIATPEQIMEIYRTALSKYIGKHDRYLDRSSNRHLIRELKQSRKKAHEKLAKIGGEFRWREAESRIFENPAVAFDYYSLLAALHAISPSDGEEFNRRIQALQVPKPSPLFYINDDLVRNAPVSSRERDYRAERIDEEYQRRLEKLEAWKANKLGSQSRELERSIERWNASLKRFTDAHKKHTRVINQWQEKIIPMVDSGEITIFQAINHLIRKMKDRSRPVLFALRNMLEPYVNYYGKGYLIIDGEPESLTDYLSSLVRRTGRASRFANRRKAEQKRCTKELLEEVEREYKKMLKKPKRRS